MAMLSRRDLTLNEPLSDTDIYLIAIDWIRYTVAASNSQEQFDTAWASTIQIDMVLDGHYEDLWRLIEVIFLLDQAMIVVQMLSAGPIEDLLGHAGAAFISRVEDKARKEPDFAKVLGGVWKSGMTDEVWNRLQAVWDRRGRDGIPE